MADKSAIGSTDEPFEMVVDRSKIREFARATKSQNTAYLDDPDAVSEPTFLMSSAFWAPAGSSLFAKVGLDLRRILHGGQEFVFHGPPPRAGARLTGTGRIDKVYQKTGRRGGVMTFLEVVYSYVDEAGDPVAEVRSTVIETANAVTGK